MGTNDYCRDTILVDLGAGRRQSRPCLRWIDGMYEYVRKLWCSNSRGTAQNRGGWGRLIRESKTLQEL
jgi:hypothetical protein